MLTTKPQKEQYSKKAPFNSIPHAYLEQRSR